VYLFYEEIMADSKNIRTVHFATKCTTTTKRIKYIEAGYLIF